MVGGDEGPRHEWREGLCACLGGRAEEVDASPRENGVERELAQNAALLAPVQGTQMERVAV